MFPVCKLLFSSSYPYSSMTTHLRLLSVFIFCLQILHLLGRQQIWLFVCSISSMLIALASYHMSLKLSPDSHVVRRTTAPSYSMCAVFMWPIWCQCLKVRLPKYEENLFLIGKTGEKLFCLQD